MDHDSNSSGHTKIQDLTLVVLAGNPTVIVENMTGAGGFIQANYMYQRAKPDGLTIGNNIGGLFLQQIMGAKGIEFDGRKFAYLGGPPGAPVGLRFEQGQRHPQRAAMVYR